MRYNISRLVHASQGTRENFEFTLETPFSFADELNLEGGVHGRVQFIKLPHEINVNIKDLKTVLKTTCARCLTACTIPVNIDFFEREFIIDLPEGDMQQGEEVFYVDTTHNEILLDEMIRQELLLHFPHIPVCSLHCKGLCDQCGVNLNEKTCSCPPGDDAQIKQFRGLNLNPRP